MSPIDAIVVEPVLCSSLSQHALCKKLDDSLFQSYSPRALQIVTYWYPQGSQSLEKIDDFTAGGNNLLTW